MRRLTEYAAELRAQGVGEVPEFDPLDGGVEAQVLFLFEKPGPLTSRDSGGSGFISRNNDDRTAEATFQFMKQAGIPRKLTVTWNVVPWWNGRRGVLGAELSSGVRCVEKLVSLLPNLRVVVLVGEKAARAHPYLKPLDVKLIISDHPSPIMRATNRERWDRIPEVWTEVMETCGP